MMRAWMAYVNLLMMTLFVTAPPVASAGLMRMLFTLPRECIAVMALRF